MTADPIKFKTTDAGVDIFVNDEGQFMAIIGNCECGSATNPRKLHSRYCRAKTIGRKSLADVERELAKAAKPARPVKVLHVDSHSAAREVEIAGVETDRHGSVRYRGVNGDLLNLYRPLYVYSDEAWVKLSAAHDRMVAAEQEYAAITQDRTLLPEVTRDVFRELVSQQNTTDNGKDS